jgi:drug/metabolite transporter (DMT)-like permease
MFAVPFSEPPMSIHDPQKIGALRTFGPLFVILGVAWMFYFMQKGKFPERSASYVALAGFSFSVTSVSMHTLNKVCISFTHSPSLVTALQMIMAVVCFMVWTPRQVLESNRTQMLKLCIVPLVYAAMLNSSLFGYQYLTLTLVTVFRNLAPLLTMAVEQVIMPPEHRPTFTLPVIASMLTMVVGALLFSWKQADFSWFGLFLVILNTLIAIFDRLLQRRLLVSECKDLPSSTCMVINNSLGLIPTFIVAGVSHEIGAVQQNATNWTDPGVIALLIMSGFMGLGIGLFGLMCQKAMTATSFQVLQNMSKVFVVSIGVTLFGDKIDSPVRAIGIFLSLAGSAAYGYARSFEQNHPKEEETLPIASTPVHPK